MPNSPETTCSRLSTSWMTFHTDSRWETLLSCIQSLDEYSTQGHSGKSSDKYASHHHHQQQPLTLQCKPFVTFSISLSFVSVLNLSLANAPIPLILCQPWFLLQFLDYHSLILFVCVLSVWNSMSCLIYFLLSVIKKTSPISVCSLNHVVHFSYSCDS